MNRTKSVLRALARPFVWLARLLWSWRWTLGFLALVWLLWAISQDPARNFGVTVEIVVILYVLAALLATLNRGSDRLIKSINESWQGSMDAQRSLTKVYEDSADRYRGMWQESNDERRELRLKLSKIEWLLIDHRGDASRSGNRELYDELVYLNERVRRIKDGVRCPDGCYELMVDNGGDLVCPGCGKPAMVAQEPTSEPPAVPVDLVPDQGGTVADEHPSKELVTDAEPASSAQG